MSVSKPFTATAVMQLVGQGRLRLDADVNTYLTRIKVPATFPEPVTIAHLLTHTAYDLLGLVVEEVSGQPFAAYMGQHLLRPLGMDGSSFRERPAAELAVSYRWDGGDFRPVSPHFFSDAPSRGLTTTATDMAR